MIKTDRYSRRVVQLPGDTRELLREVQAVRSALDLFERHWDARVEEMDRFLDTAPVEQVRSRFDIDYAEWDGRDLLYVSCSLEAPSP